MFTLKSEPQDKEDVLIQGCKLYSDTFWLSLPFALSTACFIFLSQLCIRAEHIAGCALCSLFALMMISSLIFRLYCYCNRIPNNFIHSIRHSLFRLIPLLVLSILYSMLVLSGTMLLIIPGIILSVSLMFVFILGIIDAQGILQTLLNSHRLVWGNWWHTALIISIPLMLGTIITLTSFVIAVRFFSEMPYAVFLFNAIAQIIFIPLVFSIALVLLNDLRLRRPLLGPQW